MKLTIKKASGMCIVAMLAGVASAHPGLSEKDKAAPCPFLGEQRQHQNLRRLGKGYKQEPMFAIGTAGHGGEPDGGFEAVEADLEVLMNTPQDDFWPADGGHYGGFFIRLAWHCAGSYRRSDGRGGCDGGRIRFDPELNWPDNGNLDKALMLLEPIKAKYGEDLSWGDLIILSGKVAIESMGGPKIPFCGGRIDDEDGSDSLKLGPSPEQQEIGPCDEDLMGNCLNYEGTALGTGTVGLIYVNPGGPVTDPGDRVASGHDIRRVFSMGMSFNDRETVAIVGGGHAFGKAHGACAEPPCADGGVKTSGWEGAWTTNASKWDNEFFQNLFNYEWENDVSPAGNDQWKPYYANNTEGPNIMMLTSDLALSVDKHYREISLEYANNLTTLEHDFANAFYKLTTADMGPSIRCLGNQTPEIDQPFHNDLPPAPAPEDLPDYVPARAEIQELLGTNGTLADEFINLAYKCASTYRATDHHGGCNGARIRLEPEIGWPENEDTHDALKKITEIKADFDDISYADLIVLAGVTALEHENDALKLKFCGGGVDVDEVPGVPESNKDLAPRVYDDPLITILDDFLVKGLTKKEGVALASRKAVGSEFYKNLLDEGVDPMLGDKELTKIIKAFAGYSSADSEVADNEDILLVTFEAAWTKMMTADRFKNYRENACDGVDTKTKE